MAGGNGELERLGQIAVGVGVDVYTLECKLSHYNQRLLQWQVNEFLGRPGGGAYEE